MSFSNSKCDRCGGSLRDGEWHLATLEVVCRGCLTQKEWDFIERAKKEGVVTYDIEPTSTSLCADSAIPDHMKGLRPLLDEINDLMCERGRKYGPGNIAEFGELGVLVRMSDKFARLRNGFEEYGDETVVDTLKDVVGYALIWLLLKRGQWPGKVNSPAIPPM